MSHPGLVINELVLRSRIWYYQVGVYFSLNLVLGKSGPPAKLDFVFLVNKITYKRLYI